MRVSPVTPTPDAAGPGLAVRAARTLLLTALLAAHFAVPVAAQSDVPGSAVPPVPGSAAPLGIAAEPSAAPAFDPSDGARVFVPVLRFWTTRRDISSGELRAAIEGRSKDLRRVLVGTDDPAGLWARLGVTPAANTTVASPEDVAAAVAGSRRTLGLLLVADVRPDLRALAVDGMSLFGAERLADMAAWPLRDDGPAATAAAARDPDATVDPEGTGTWTLAAGGDVMLDREVYRQAVTLGKGADHPWDLGYAAITGRTCCNVSGGNDISTANRGPRGAVRALLSSADIALVNHEGPAPDAATYHPSGFTFTFDASLLPGLRDAGIDIVSLANNHIRNAGSEGVLQTMRNLRRAGIRHVGAGRDADAARRTTCLDAAGTRVCFLAYDAINTVLHAATDDRPGAAELRSSAVRHDIRAARQAGADVVIVVPHWGVEYTTRVTAQQRRWARAMVRAGADAVLGGHSHVVGPLEFIDGVPVVYSMGDLLFDLPRFEETEEGVIVELTFQGSRLAQLDLHPTVIVDRSRLALLDPAADGRVVLERMRAASRHLTPMGGG